MKNAIKEILNGQQSGLSASLVRGSAKVFVIQVVGLSLAFVLNVSWVRFLGPDGFGHYSFALSWVNVLAVVGSMGWGTANIRLIPKLRVENRLGELSGLVISSFGLTTFASLVIGVIYFLIIPNYYSEVPIRFHAISGALVIPVSLLLVGSGVLKGLKMVVAAQFIHLIIRTLLMLAMIGLVRVGIPVKSLPLTGVTINFLASFCALCLFLVLIRLFFKENIRETLRKYRFRKWFSYSLPLAMIIGFNVVNSRVGVLATGVFLSPEETGQYAACVQLALLAGFGLLVFGMVAQPYLSELYSKNDFKQINVTLRLTARGALLLTVPILVGVLIGGKWLLALMSETFVEAYPVLVILTMGQVFSVMSGQVGTLMVMTDMQHVAMAILGFSVVLHIVLLFVFVPMFGLIGTGISFVLTTVFWNVAMSVAVWRKLGLRATAI